MDDRSLQLIEYDQVTAAVAAHCRSPRGTESMRGWGPIQDAGARAEECGLLAEALARDAEAEPWCAVGTDDLRVTLATLDENLPEGIDLLVVLSWLDAGRTTREAWAERATADRFPGLGARAAEIPSLNPLRARLREALDDDGGIRDSASPELQKLRRAVAQGERRVRFELGRAVAAARSEIETLESILVHFDTLLARARWARSLGAIALKPEGETLRLDAARHPLLAMGLGAAPEAVVPLDLELHGARVPGKVLLVSGPNMGGKTVLLKTVGLAVALSHAALPVTAAEGSRVPELDRIVVDLGDEQSLAQGLSTFAGHLQALAVMADAAGPRTLVLCDEIGAGTDPDDGVALARALLEHLVARGAWVVANTHLGGLKRLAGEVPGIENGSLEFDLATLTPRFRFLPGVPGASHALSVAARLGFPTPLLERAHALRPAGAGAIEQLLADLAEATQAVRQERERLREACAAAEGESARWSAATEEAHREQAALRRRLTLESEALLGRVRELWQTVQREARRGEKSRSSAEALRQELNTLEREVDEMAARATGTEGPVTPIDDASLAPGARVRVMDLGVEAEVVSGPDREGRVQLRRGSWQIQSHVGRLARASAPAEATARPVAGTWVVPEGTPMEADLRGMEASEALAALDQAVDRAVLAGFTELRVIHGIGKGILRAAVERHLRDHAQVSSQRPGQVGEGGRGVTIARLR